MTEESAETGTWEGSSPWLFLLGTLVFVGGLLVYLYDLASGTDVLRGIAANGVGAALLIAWAAHDTLFDPDSEVATASGATGTALLLYGLYLLFAGVAITVTGLFFHDRGGLGLWYVALSLFTVVIGFFIYPTGSVIEDDEREPDGDAETTPTDRERDSD